MRKKMDKYNKDNKKILLKTVKNKLFYLQISQH